MSEGTQRAGERSEPSGLTVENISHAFRVPGAGRFSRRKETRAVLEDVSFAVAPGTLTAIGGLPGGVAYHPQRDALLPWLRALDNATLGAETCGRDLATARREAMELLDRFGLSGQQNAWPDELSGGMRQRVALMRTFLMPQQVLVLDEPLGALDALTLRTLRHRLLEIVASARLPTFAAASEMTAVTVPRHVG